MKRVFDLAEKLSDLFWNDFDHCNKKVQNTVGCQIINSSDCVSKPSSEFLISNFA